MDVSFSGLLSYIEERAEKLLQSGEYTKATTGHLKTSFSEYLEPIQG
jgi:tRNA A37 threonylcarbamoyltransferase TsaD